jgi:hypothetical protein
MTSFNLITDDELAQFGSVLKKNGWREQDFELQEEEIDQAEAEVETCTGRVGIRNLSTQAVEVYRLGPGWEWVADFARDLGNGRFGQPAGIPPKSKPLVP